MKNIPRNFITFLITCVHLSKGNWPPGPKSVSVIGNLGQLGKTPHKQIFDWRVKYGPMIGLDMGSYRAVALNDYKLIQDALAKDEFSGRPTIDVFIERTGGKPEGVLFTKGRHWHEQRSFSMNQLNTFGINYGTKTLEQVVQFEAQEMIEIFKGETGKPINMANRFKSTILNIMWTIFAGQRFGFGDKTAQTMINLIEANSPMSDVRGALVIFLPEYAKVELRTRGYERAKAPVINLVKFLQPYIDEHRDTFKVGHIRDFIDGYLNEINKATDPSSSFQYDSLVYTLADVLVAGVETVGATMSWITNILVRNPRVQNKLGDEILGVIGTARLPELQDRDNMPYTNAVIAEVMRYRTLVPLSIFHSTTNNVEFHGYSFPNETMIFPNLYAAHHDPSVWGDPEKFRPERFLTQDGTFSPHEAFMQFSSGHRFCLGKKVAQDELFLLVSILFQNFELSRDPMPTLEPVESALSLPRIQNIVLTFRS